MSDKRQGGRFSSAYDERGLPDAVRDVALHVRPDAPATVTQDEFDRARCEVPAHAKAPTARQICRRLGVSWPQLLDALFRGGDVVRFIGQRQGAADDHGLTHDHVAKALRLVASRVGVRTLRPAQYETARHDLLADGRIRYRHGQQLMFPTVGQVERVAGSWDRALELAGLEPRPGAGGLPSTVSYQEAVRRFLTSQGAMPTITELEAFARAQGFPLPRRPGRHRQLLQEVQAEFAAQGRWAPAAPPPKELRASYVFGDRGESNPGGGRRKKRRSEDECVAGIVAYLDDMRAGQRATQKGYIAWVVGTGHPSARSFGKYGGWTALLAEARAQRRSRQP